MKFSFQPHPCAYKTLILKKNSCFLQFYTAIVHLKPGFTLELITVLKAGNILYLQCRSIIFLTQGIEVRNKLLIAKFRSSRPEVFLGKGVLKIRSKLTGEHPCRSAISIKLFCNLIKIAHRHGCSPANLLRIFRTPFPRKTSGWLLQKVIQIFRNF